MSMNALDALKNRVSIPLVEAPAPSGEVLANIKQAAMRTADHALLRPWRFLVVEGEGLDRLGQLFVAAKCATGAELSGDQQQRLAAQPKRAPLVIVAIACCQEHSKVPEVEQVISTGCAVQNMINAAYAQNVGAMWRTGEMAYNSDVHKGLGLAENEQLVGFLYLGTPKGPVKPVPEMDPEQYFSSW